MNYKKIKFILFFFLCLFLWLASPITLKVDEPISQMPEDESVKKNEIEHIIKQSVLYREAKKFAKAQRYLEKALKEFTGKKEKQKMLKIALADVHYWWANDFKNKGKSSNAISQFEMAYAIDKIYRHEDAAIELCNIGVVYATLGDKKKALEYINKALLIMKRLGNHEGEAAALNNAGRLYAELGEIHKALRHFEKALSLFKAMGNRNQEVTVLNIIGRLYFTLGQKQKALKYLKKTLPLFQAMGECEEVAKTLNYIGVVYSNLGQMQKALNYFENALSVIQEAECPVGEATILRNIGRIYDDIGQNHKALEYLQRALALFQAIEDRAGELKTLTNIGKVYYELGRHSEALEYYEKALPVMNEIGDLSEKDEILNGIGGLYSALGHKQKALKYLKKALQIIQSVGNRPGEGTLLNNIGKVYSDLGQIGKALEYYERAMLIQQEVGDRAGEARTLNNIGRIYTVLRQKQKALDYFEKALVAERATGYREGEATTLNNIGLLYIEFGQSRKALEYFQKSLPLIRSVGNNVWEASILNNIGGLYDELGQKRKALEYYKKALPLRQTVRDRDGEAVTLNNIGAAYLALDQRHIALDYFLKSLVISQLVEDRDGEARVLNNLMICWESKECKLLPIFFGKQSINIIEQLRENVSRLEKKMQRSYLESKKDTYRFLTEILVSMGRLSEAQQVLDMLKEEEYFNFIRNDRNAASALSIQVDFTEFEKRWYEKFKIIMQKLFKISSEYHALAFEKNKNETELKRLKKMESKLKAAKKSYKEFLVQLKAVFDKHEKEIKEGKITPLTLAKKVREVQTTLKYLDKTGVGKNVALHYLAYGGRITVILTLATHQSVVQTKIDETKFNEMILSYRNLVIRMGKIKRGIERVEESADTLKKCAQKKQKYENQMYNVIFKPLVGKLKKYGATNLNVSLDGVLRYIPMAVLWDGEDYLVQKYRISLITPSSLKNIRGGPIIEKRILGLGVGDGGNGFSPLPYVKREIRSIVRDEGQGYAGLIKGKAFLDDDFTRDTMISQLKKKYPLVHISSHFQFSPGDETKNHLLLGDGTTIKLSEIRDMGKLFEGVKLLVLSACQTGVGGNGEEIDGFGELAQQSGAEGVIASLWPVADESTKELMVAFYKNLKAGKGISKIEALRQAQLELAGLEDLLGKDRSTIGKSTRKNSRYGSSYFWGPFIMIGNWR